MPERHDQKEIDQESAVMGLVFSAIVVPFAGPAIAFGIYDGGLMGWGLAILGILLVVCMWLLAIGMVEAAHRNA